MTPILTPSARQVLLARRSATHGRDGIAWVERLPDLVRSLAAVWKLTLEKPSEGVSYNFVASVRRSDGSPAVLKVCYPDADFLHEEQALRAFGGRGCVALVESDVQRGALLLAALQPGTPVSTLHDDAAEVSATAAVMRALHRPPPQDHAFPSIADWIEAVARGKDEPREDWLDRAVSLGRELAGWPLTAAVLLHGDLHHGNVLASGDGWLAIDPKGVTGEAAWEPGPYLYNNLPDAAGEAGWRRTAQRRVDQFADEMGLDRRRLSACAAVYAALSLAWSLEEGDLDPVFAAKRRAVMRQLGGF